MLTTSSNCSGTLNPEAHEFKSKSLPENPSMSNEDSSEDYSGSGKNNKGKYGLKNMNNTKF